MNNVRRLAALLMTLIMVCSSCASVSAANVLFPSALTEIDDEAFSNSGLFQGLVEVPDGVTHIGSNAFAGSDVYALSLPIGLETLGDHNAQEMAYVCFNDPVLPSPLPSEFNVRYVFANSNTSVSSWASQIGATFVDRLELLKHEGFYYQVNYETNECKLLCAVDNSAVPENVTIPEKLGIMYSVTELSPNAFFGCNHVTSITLAGSPEEQDGCFDGAPNAIINRNADPEISLKFAKKVDFEPAWFCELTVVLGNTSYDASASENISCAAEFLNSSGTVVLTQENAVSLTIPQTYSKTECTVNLDNQLWARAYQAGARQLRIALRPEEGVPVNADYNAVTIDLPASHPYPIVLLEYNDIVKPSSDYIIKATCLNPEAMTQYQPVELCDSQGNQISVAYIGTYHPNCEFKQFIQFVDQGAPSYLVRYPGADSSATTYTHTITPDVSAFTGIEGIVSTGGESPKTITMIAGETLTLKCTYLGVMPNITCFSWNSSIITAQMDGDTVTLTAVGSGDTKLTVSDESTGFIIPVTVTAGGVLTGFTIDGVPVDTTTGFTLDVRETIELECTYTGILPEITYTFITDGYATAELNGDVISITGVSNGSTSICISDGTNTVRIPFTVNSGTITGIYNSDGNDASSGVTVNVRETCTLEYTYTDPMPIVTCTSWNESIATAQVDGSSITINGLNRGNTYISIYDGTTSVLLPVTVESGTVTGLLNPDGTDASLGITMNTGDTHTMEFTYTGVMPNVTLSFSNEGVATAQVDGTTITITAIGTGSTSMYISDGGIYSHGTSIKVVSGQITEYPLNRDLDVYIGETATLMFGYSGDPVITCYSFNENVATAERDGSFILVKGVGNGSTAIHISDESGKLFSISVDVPVNPDTPVKLTGLNNGNPVYVGVGQCNTSVQIVLNNPTQGILPDGLTVTSSDESIAKVLHIAPYSAYVLGVTAGTAQLTASDGVDSFTVDVHVTDDGMTPLPVLWIDTSNDGATLGIDPATGKQLSDLSAFTVKLCTSTPAFQFMMPFEIGLNWEFLAEDGSVIDTTYTPFYNNVMGSDNSILLKSGLGISGLYKKGVSKVRATLAPIYHSYVVEHPQRTITFDVPKIEEISGPFFTFEAPSPVAIGTEAVLKFECLNPEKLPFAYPVSLQREDGTVIKLGELTVETPYVTATVAQGENASEQFTFLTLFWDQDKGWYEVPYDTVLIEFMDFSAFQVYDTAVAVGTSTKLNMDWVATPIYSIEDESIATIKDGRVTGVSLGETTVSVQYGNAVRTAKVRVYDPAALQPAALSLELDRSVWPWVAEGTEKPWTVKVKANKPANELDPTAKVNVSVTFKDAQDNALETAKGILVPVKALDSMLNLRFDSSNETVGYAIADQAMFNRMAAAGAVKAVVRIESVSGCFTIDPQNRSVEIPMDSLSNYPDEPMISIINNNPYELKVGDPVSFTIKAGNTTVDKDYNLELRCERYNGTPYLSFPTTFNPAKDREKTFTVTIPASHAGYCYFLFYNLSEPETDQYMDQFSISISPN